MKRTQRKIQKKYPFLLPVYSTGSGAQYNPYFFQLLFESQSCDLVNELFRKETSNPYITNPLECFVTAWCVANSSPTSRWSLDLSMLVNFVDHFEQFGCWSTKRKHGTIMGLHVNSSKGQALSRYSTILSSFSSFFPCLEYLYFNDIPIVDITHFVPLFSGVHKLVSLKVFGITIEGDEGGLPAVTIPPQHCPSLLAVILQGRASSFLFQSLALPNINTLTTLCCPLASSDFSSLCTGLCRTTSLKWLVLLDTDLTTHEAKELASALEQNRSLENVEINEDTVTITDDGIRILRQVLSSHPTVNEFALPDTVSADLGSSATASDDDELQLAMAMSLSMVTQEEQMKSEEEEELQRVLSLSLVDQ